MQGVGSLQIMSHTIRLKEPPVYNGEMDYDLVESWIFNIDIYFVLVGLTDPIKQTRFAATLLQKQAALWL